MPHIHEKIDFTISAFIVHKNTVLLVEHKQLKKWLPIGGHIEFDENPEQALFREIQEESGLDKKHLRALTTKPLRSDKHITYLLTPNYLDIHDISTTHKHIGLTYFLTATSKKILLNQGEHTGIKWFTTDEIEDPSYAIIDNVKFYATQAFAAAIRSRVQ